MNFLLTGSEEMSEGSTVPSVPLAAASLDKFWYSIQDQGFHKTIETTTVIEEIGRGYLGSMRTCLHELSGVTSPQALRAAEQTMREILGKLAQEQAIEPVDVQRAEELLSKEPLSDSELAELKQITERTLKARLVTPPRALVAQKVQLLREGLGGGKGRGDGHSNFQPLVSSAVSSGATGDEPLPVSDTTVEEFWKLTRDTPDSSKDPVAEGTEQMAHAKAEKNKEEDDQLSQSLRERWERFLGNKEYLLTAMNHLRFGRAPVVTPGGMTPDFHDDSTPFADLQNKADVLALIEDQEEAERQRAQTTTKPKPSPDRKGRSESEEVA
jgi:hypothetical protein